MSRSRRLLAQLVWVHHLVVSLFIAVAWALPWSWAAWTGLILYPLVQLNWWIFDDRCVLTVIEERLRRGSESGSASSTGAPPLHFVQQLGSRVLGRPTSRFWADVLSYAFVWGGLAIVSLRLYLRS